MRELSRKQASFVRYKLEGLSNKDAVVAAGYSANGAKQAGTRLMAHPCIRAKLLSSGYVDVFAIQREKQRVTRSWRKVLNGGPIPYTGMPKNSYKSAVEFLFDAMNNQALSILTRAACAAALLPYFHAKLGKAPINL